MEACGLQGGELPIADRSRGVRITILGDTLTLGAAPWPNLQSFFARGNSEFLIELREERLNKPNPYLTTYPHGYYPSEELVAQCSNPLCCHTRHDCRLVSGLMRAELWPGSPQDDDYDPCGSNGELAFGGPSFDRLARMPGTSRLRKSQCPAVLEQRKSIAEFHKWRRGCKIDPERALTSLGATWRNA